MRVLIAGGGTGGHLFPGIALAEEILERRGEVLFVGTDRGLEARVIPELGLALSTIHVRGLARVSWMQRLRFLIEAPITAAQAAGVLLAFRPSVVVGVGGYSSGPVVLAAAAVGLPTAILEQNSVPGITNRLLGRVVNRVFGSFEESRGFFADRKMAMLGNPVRRAIVDSLQDASADSFPTRDTPVGPINVLVFGGSQGAQFLNDCLIEGAQALAALDINLVHQTGAADHQRVLREYEHAGLHAEVLPFLDDMAARYARADLIVCRAGATTLAELAIVGRPAVLVPFPFATHNHQERNARAFEQRGAAVCRTQGELDGAALAALIGELAADPSRRRELATAMGASGRPKAAHNIVDQLELLAGERADR